MLEVHIYVHIINKFFDKLNIHVLAKLEQEKNHI